MTTYHCKCGRVVKKSTKASTTGNRDTGDCVGCPYLLPYGPNEWSEDQKSFVQKVAGYECRMTDHPVDYASHASSCGGPNDKTVLHVESLDFDFLDTITEWVHEEFKADELTGGFNREALRAPEYMDGYRMTFYPAQNKKGIEAKQRLFRRFFHPDGTRLDMNPEEEKAKILADIEDGKTVQRKEPKMNKAYEKNPHDKPQECTAEEIENPTSAPDFRVDAEDAMAPAQSAAGTASLEDGQGFDYSGLTQKTEDALRWAEGQIRDARRKYIIDVAEAVAIVHEELVQNLDEHSNQYSEETFVAWCRYVGISKSTAYNLLQVNALMSGATPEEMAQLEQASPSLLYAAAKPSAPAELVQAVKDGDITTHKQYQEAMARIKALESENRELKHENEMERKEQEGANAAAMKFKAECDRRAQDQQRLEGLVESANQKADLAAQKSTEAWEQLVAEKKARKEAEKERDKATNERDGARQALQAAKLRGDKLKEENEALKAQPIEAAVVDQGEVNRRAQEIADRQTSEQAEESQRNAYDNVLLSLRSIENNWTLAINAFRSLPADMQRGLIDKLLKFSAKVKEDTQCL